MNEVNTFVILLAFFAGQCMGMGMHSNDDDDDDEGLTMGQIAAMAIGGAVIFALLIIAIVAIILKCNKKAKPAIQPAYTHDASGVTGTNKVPAAPYAEPPPKYSLRDDGPSHQMSLPPYSETYPTKHVL